MQKALHFILLLSLLGLVVCCSKDVDGPKGGPVDRSFVVIEIPVVHHIIRDDNGLGAAIDTSAIKFLIQSLNEDFNLAGLYFKSIEVNYVDNDQWNQSFDPSGGYEALKAHEDPGALNLFYFNGLAGSVIISSPPNEGSEVLSEAAALLDNPVILTTAIGHYFGLYNIDNQFKDEHGVLELVNGSNCAESGDFICDTKASPILTNANIDSENCRYVGIERDANGEMYQPDVNNFMHDYNESPCPNDGLCDPCKMSFTPGQIRRMRSNIRESRPYLLNNSAPEILKPTERDKCPPSIYHYDMSPRIMLDSLCTIDVVHFISRDDNGLNAVTDSSNISLMMTYINTNFQDWGIRFRTKEIKFVDNSVWNQSFSKQDDFKGQRVLEPYEDDKSLNVFYFDRLLSNGSDIGATALFPHEGNNIKLSSRAFASDNTGTMTHEIGHWLGLLHTDDDNRDCDGELELVNGANCEDAGDLICDTPADPNLDSDNVNDMCQYTGNDRDVNGDLYKPDPFNFMTTYRGVGCESPARVNCGICRRRFTPQQMKRAKAVLASLRSHLF